jgi:hypothetical protein
MRARSAAILPQRRSTQTEFVGETETMSFVLSGMRSAIAAVICIAVALTLFTPSAHGQKIGRGGKGNPQNDAAAAEKKKKAREIDDAYKAALKAIPDKPRTDPWGNMR